MGAEFQTTVTDKKPTQDDYDEIVEDAKYMHGHGGYSGSFAEAGGRLTYHHERVADADAAEDWLSENCRKWDPGIAIEFVADGEGNTKWMIGAVCSS